MKKLALLLFIGILFAACDKDDDKKENNDSSTEISLGANYANDIYYSLANGVVATVDRKEWDIAFYTDSRASTILTNDGNGIKLYVAEVKTEWENVSAITDAYLLYNTYSDTTWQNGAFDKGKNGDMFDYGWGFYDMATHTVVGDSIHVIELADGTIKKLFIEKRDAATSSYHIKYANLDGSDEVTEIINTADHTDKNFIHYSLKNKTVVSHEPDKNTWDLMFTKYYDVSETYIVMGALANEGTMIAQVDNTTSDNNDYQTANYSKVVNTIGSDWKAYDMSSHSFNLVNDRVYFIKDNNGSYHKLYFTAYGGQSSGNIEFEVSNY